MGTGEVTSDCDVSGVDGSVVGTAGSGARLEGDAGSTEPVTLDTPDSLSGAEGKVGGGSTTGSSKPKSAPRRANPPMSTA